MQPRILLCMQCGKLFAENDPNGHITYENSRIETALCSQECLHEYSLMLLKIATQELRQKKQRGLTEEDKEMVTELHRRLGDLLKGKTDFPEQEKERAK